jgi:hypothetical protein
VRCGYTQNSAELEEGGSMGVLPIPEEGVWALAAESEAFKLEEAFGKLEESTVILPE